MTADAKTGPEDTPKAPRKPRGRKRRGLYHGLRISWFLMTVTCVALLGGALYLASGRPIDAPQWLRDRIEARATAEMPGANLSFGRMQLVVVEGLKPRLRLTDVRLENDAAQQIVGFSQLDTALALEPLLSGRVEPQEVLISGVFATLRRAKDGSLSLSGGFDLSSPTRSAPSLVALLKQLDDLLLQPALANLTFVDIQALTLQYEDIGSGRAWTIDGGRGQLIRSADNITISADLALLSGADGIATLATNYATTLGGPAAEFGVTFTDVAAKDIAAQGPAFAWLSALRAPISGALRAGVDDAGNLSPLNATLSVAEGAVQPTPATRPIPFKSAKIYFTVDTAANLLSFDELAVDSQWVKGKASGTAWLGGLEDSAPQDLVAQFSITELALNPFQLYKTPQVFPRASADLRLSLDPFRIELGQAVINLDGENLVLSGDLRAEDEGWRLALDAYAAALTPERVIDLWPAAYAPKTRRWLDTNILAAEMRDIDVALRGNPGAPVETFVSFDYDAADVRFMKTMPPLQSARGHVSLAENRVVVAVDAGRVTAPDGGDLDVAGSNFIIPNIRLKDKTLGEVQLKTNSAIEAVLSIIDQPPLNIMQKAGRGVDIAKGRALLEGTIGLPLRAGVKTEDVAYQISGQLQQVSSTALVPNRTISAASLILEATPDAILIGGPGTLDGVPFEAAWSQALGAGAAGEVNGTIPLSQATLDAFKIGLPPGSVRGSAAADITVSLPKGAPPTFTLSSNLRGAALRLAPLGWSKSQGTAGTFRVTGSLGERPAIDRLQIDAAGLTADGSVSLRANGALSEARFARVRVGNWFDAPVRLIGRGAAPPEVRVTGGRIDMRQATFGSGSGGGAGNGPITLSLDRLQISDTISLTNFAGQFAAGRGLNGRFSARVNGGAGIEGRAVPQNGRSALQITSADAGGVLAASGILKQARGGDMTLTLLPVPGAEGVLDGSLRVKNTRVKKAPVMADLLSAISIIGLLEQLSGNGIAFTEVEAEFRMTPTEVVLRRASAVGPSMGISMDGRYGMKNGAMDMQGVVSPVYFLNALGQIFSRRGEGLIGFNYRVRGSATSPKVQVNPLSALTPGLFREIFRARPPDLPAADAPRALVPAELAPAQKPDKPKRTPGQIASDER